MSRRKKILSIWFSVIIFVFLGLTAQAANLKDAFSGSDGSKSILDTAADKAGYKMVSGNSALEEMVGKVINAFLSLLGVIFIGLIIYSGFLWMTARGDENKVSTAKDILKTSITGLIIILAAYGISYYVLQKLTSGTLK